MGYLFEKRLVIGVDLGRQLLVDVDQLEVEVLEVLLRLLGIKVWTSG